jgi:mannose-6-phosphate isomerase
VAQIPLLAKHRIQICGIEPLVFIEVKWGNSFEEADIVRVEDDYNRS